MNDQYRIDNPDQVDSPALIVFPDIVKNNIRQALAMTGGVSRLRPHVKTHKNPQVALMMLEAGIRKFKCATIAEAEMLGRQGAPDVLLAYPLLGPKRDRFIHLTRHFPGTQYSCLVDNADMARALEAKAAAAGVKVDVYLDLNTGMNRTGIIPGESAKELYRYLSASDHFTIRGLHAYDGHIRHPDIEERKRACDTGFEQVTRLRDELVQENLAVPNIIAGGSPSFPIHAMREGVDCSPGTFIYWDRGYQLGCPEQPFQCAAILLTRVVSRPAADTWCTDLGHKSVAAENEMSRRVHLPDLPGWVPVSQSEEHLVLKKEDTSVPDLQAGDVVYAIPYHICPTVALYDRVIFVEKGIVAGEAENVARARRIEI